MPLVLALTRGSPWSDSSNGMPSPMLLAATNPGATAITVQSLQVSETTRTGAFIAQPECRAPNSVPGMGNVVVPPGGTAYFPFAVAFPTPAGAGSSPQAPGGATTLASPAANSTAILQAQCYASDGTVSSTFMSVPVLSTIAPFPLAQGGAMQLSSGFNLVNFLTAFA